MRDLVMQQLVRVINSNLGNRLTSELGAGIVSVMDQFLQELEAGAAEKVEEDSITG